MKKIALFAYNGELMCFAHVMLYAQELKEKGYDARIVIEGTATKLIKELGEPGTPFSDLYGAIKEAGLIDCVCMACSKKMGAYDEAVAQGLRVEGGMKGHPSLERYIAEGFSVYTF